MEVTDDLVRHVARLSRLDISREEAVGLKRHFEKILAYIAAFQALDTRDVDPGLFSVESQNVFRADEPRPSLDRAEALRNAPQQGDGFFVVPRIVGAEGGAAGGQAKGGAGTEAGGHEAGRGDDPEVSE
ncbi:MAG: Asp-tRNA(Asn)/Glu-tRNA(Gln) amidotransferase subunit GatC [Planctomycetes bacterium]|nr:Asp-tRNA(Asn)/Glu-tRNA(Gln) amidotransferase subunit GatC [Planctomycetota bacterium]